MSEMTKKRPAHEVILNELANAVKMLDDSQWFVVQKGQVRLATLCDVLATMMVPEEKRTEVAGEAFNMAKDIEGRHDDESKALLRVWRAVGRFEDNP